MKIKGGARTALFPPMSFMNLAARAESPVQHRGVKRGRRGGRAQQRLQGGGGHGEVPSWAALCAHRSLVVVKSEVRER